MTLASSETSADYSRGAYRLMLRSSGLVGVVAIWLGLFLAAEIDNGPVYCAGKGDGTVVFRQVAVSRIMWEGRIQRTGGGVEKCCLSNSRHS